MKCFDLKDIRDQLWQQLAGVTAQHAADHTPLATEPWADVRRAGEIADLLTRLAQLEVYWAWPGRQVIERLLQHFNGGQIDLLAQLAGNVWQALQAPWQHSPLRSAAPSSEEQRCLALDRPLLRDSPALTVPERVVVRPAFEVLVLQPSGEGSETRCKEQLSLLTCRHDPFVIDLVFVTSAEDALVAVLANPGIQACVLPDSILSASDAAGVVSAASLALYAAHVQPLLATTREVHGASSAPSAAFARSPCDGLAELADQLHRLRPELILYRAGSHCRTAPRDEGAAQEACATEAVDAIYPLQPFAPLHSALLQDMAERYATPFFAALQAYSQRPRAVFHALPASRGASLVGSPWVQDLLQFYGDNVFLAETSATQGGLDSLLEPCGVIRRAQTLAARAFGADCTFFVTNGTSSANKIVIQSTLQPGDLVIVGADCHHSVAQAIAMCGAHPIFVTARPLPDHDLYSAVDLVEIKSVLIDLRRHGRLHRLKQVILTNSSFDGLVCDVERFMLDLLALKPDLVFQWDEAWFAFAHFHPLYAGRNAMSAVRRIRERLASPRYRAQYVRWRAKFEATRDPLKWQRRLLPDPDRVQLRVYATQSTHKTLSAFRQGSMIQVADDCFDAALFSEALRTHTSTSPNYQILASLDVARRQACIEGYQRVRHALSLALQLRRRVAASPELRPWFEVLDDDAMLPSYAVPPADSVPADESLGAIAALSRDWVGRDWVVDPTRVTLNIRRSGLDGSALRRLLMDRYDIHVNKTSRHTVLFMVHIGSTQATIDHLLAVLHDLAARLSASGSTAVVSRTDDSEPALPEKRLMHRAFVPHPDAQHPACDLRLATQAGRDDAMVTYRTLAELLADSQTATGDEPWVSATLVTPYPPGFPLLLPGQLITQGVLRYLHRLHIKEIHGLCPDRGVRVFQPGCLPRRLQPTSAPLNAMTTSCAAKRKRLNPAPPAVLTEA
jgi:arginine decarboxylase